VTHPNTPSLDKLKEIQKALYLEPSTYENIKKLKAIESQIERIEEEECEP